MNDQRYRLKKTLEQRLAASESQQELVEKRLRKQLNRGNRQKTAIEAARMKDAARILRRDGFMELPTVQFLCGLSLLAVLREARLLEMQADEAKATLSAALSEAKEARADRRRERIVAVPNSPVSPDDNKEAAA